MQAILRGKGQKVNGSRLAVPTAKAAREKLKLADLTRLQTGQLVKIELDMMITSNGSMYMDHMLIIMITAAMLAQAYAGNATSQIAPKAKLMRFSLHIMTA